MIWEWKMKTEIWVTKWAPTIRWNCLPSFQQLYRLWTHGFNHHSKRRVLQYTSQTQSSGLLLFLWLEHHETHKDAQERKENHAGNHWYQNSILLRQEVLVHKVVAVNKRLGGNKRKQNKHLEIKPLQFYFNWNWQKLKKLLITDQDNDPECIVGEDG